MRLGLLAAAWLAGIFIGLRLDVSAFGVLLLFLALLAAGPLLRRYRLSLWIAVMAGVLLIALLRVEAGDEPVASLATEDGQAVTMRGRIIDDPEATRQRIKFVVAVEAVDRGEGLMPHSAKALVYAGPPDSLVSLREPPYFRYGDALQIEGQLELPRTLADFDYPAYLANQGISGILWAREVSLIEPRHKAHGGWRGTIFDLRRNLSENIEDALPLPQSAVAQAMLLGQRGQLPDDLVNGFRQTGTSHLLAISGLHVGAMMVMALAAAGAIMGRRWGAYMVFALALIWMYALVSGLPPSVVRAAIMGTVYLAAAFLGRPRSALPALALSAAAMVAWSPQVIQQVSFQLSFAAMAGIALAMPCQLRVSSATVRSTSTSPILGSPWLRPVLYWTVSALVVSVAATLATWPLVAFNFERIPLLGIIATVLALPALPLLLVGALATALTGFLHPAIGQLFGWITWVPLSYLIELISWVPSYTISGAWVGSGLVWAWYLALGSLLLLAEGATIPSHGRSRLGWLLRRPATLSAIPARGTGSAPLVITVSVLLLAASIFVWVQVFSGPSGKLHVYFFDVGQGDSALIVTPSGKQVLVDGGPASQSATAALAQTLSRGDRSLDMVVLTHLDADHSRGLIDVLDRYQVASVLVSMEHPESSLYHQWQAALERGDSLKIPVRAGHKVILEPDVSLEVLNPPPGPDVGTVADQNNSSVVLRLVHGSVSFLLAADVEAKAESYLSRYSPTLASAVLKVAHHGSRTSTTPVFLDRVGPAVAVMSVGADNRFGHPHPDVVRRLGQALRPGSVYRTDLHGTVEFISDGNTLSVRTDR